MIGRIGRFLFGEVRFRVDAPPHLAASAFIDSGAPVYGAKAGEGYFEAFCERRDKKFILSLCKERGLECTVLSERGLLPFLAAAILRPGLILGVAAALLALWESQNYVWQIRVYGNERLTGEQVEELLSSHGFFVGCRHKSIDLHLLCNEIPMQNEDVAWISINMLGAVAEVRLVENRPPPEDGGEAKEGALVNLVASREGQIVRYELSSGRAMVSVGETVFAGQLLAAGWSEKDSGLHPRVSAGKVYAKTVLIKEVFVPYERRKEVETRRTVVKKSVNISGKEIFFYKKGRLSGEKYDIVKEGYRPTVLGVELPLTVTAYLAVFTEERTAVLSPEEARKEAEKLLFDACADDGATLIKTTFIFIEKEDGLRGVLTAECILNIAKPVPVEMN